MNLPRANAGQSYLHYFPSHSTYSIWSLNPNAQYILYLNIKLFQLFRPSLLSKMHYLPLYPILEIFEASLPSLKNKKQPLILTDNQCPKLSLLQKQLKSGWVLLSITERSQEVYIFFNSTATEDKLVNLFKKKMYLTLNSDSNWRNISKNGPSNTRGRCSPGCKRIRN